MCLRYSRNKPWNHSNIRWKLMYFVRKGEFHPRYKHGYFPAPCDLFVSPYQGTPWEHNRLITGATRNLNLERTNMDEFVRQYALVQAEGIHVFASLTEARQVRADEVKLYHDHYALVEVRVKGFITGGYNYNVSRACDGTRGECWQEATITRRLI